MAQNEYERVTILKLIVANLKILFQGILATDILKIIKVFVVIFMGLFLIGFSYLSYKIIDDENTYTRIVEIVTRPGGEHEENIMIRDAITPKINFELEKMIYSSGADRVVIFEFHNGKANATDLPFKFADMTFEIINDGRVDIMYCADKWQNIPLSLYKMPYYLAKNTYLMGDIEAVRQVDARFAQAMTDMSGNYMDAVMIRSNGYNIGVVAFFYEKGNKPKVSGDEAKAALDKCATTIGRYLDLEIQRQVYVDANGHINKDKIYGTGAAKTTE